jgi:type II restriction enzyme
MQLSMNPTLTLGYKNRSQIARVLSEDWATRNLYCAVCNASSVGQQSNNTRAVDFSCRRCTAGYQLKSSLSWHERRIPDAGYEAMISAIRSDNVPNLLVMQYTPDWTVKNLILVPSFFFTEAAIECRAPLGPMARRAGWVGCNILLSNISPEGKIRLVTNHVACDPETVRQEYKRIRPLSNLQVSLRGWTLNVLRIVHKIATQGFTLDEVYQFEAELSILYPRNNNVRAKIRQQLQILRDIGLIKFMGRGKYSL